MHLCNYGCGKKAIYQLKNGKWCCSKSHNICSVNKEKNRQKKLGEKNPMFNKSITKEHREKLILNAKEKILGKTIEERFGEEKAKKILLKMKNAQLGDKHPLWNKHHTPESKLKMRLSSIEYMKKLYGNICPRYNKDACKIIEEYNKQGYNFQHAENGGEYYIEELGYWLDGYDSEKNIVIEIDEQAHFDNHGRLRQKDIIRQKEIENFLDCLFIRVRVRKTKKGIIIYNKEKL